MNGSGLKVLFVSSGKNGKPGDVVLNQGESLKRQGIDIRYLLVRPGLSGYLSAISSVRREWKSGNYDLVHAHYSLSAISASLAGRFPLVVSLMGSDVFMSRLLRIVTAIMARYRWSVTIVKTEQMKKMPGLQRAEVIPNGVDMDVFRPMPKEEARRTVGYSDDRKLIVFISAPGRPEKNFALASEAVALLDDPAVELRRLYGMSPADISYWLNAADLLLLTSRWEGSPNVIKEAMACNCPIVFTDVGDARVVAGDTAGCFVTSHRPEDVAAAIRNALTFGSRTVGRQRIADLGLDSVSVAGRIISVYEGIVTG